MVGYEIHGDLTINEGFNHPNMGDFLKSTTVKLQLFAADLQYPGVFSPCFRTLVFAVDHCILELVYQM